ncbi:MAG: type I toxin-antitoxin system Fst family toxin [Staphylococcus equorum]|nr:type I toxin-antitoxin system Fst family toxin [Staphylococcus equorum]MDG0822650.1 type I toxin-antitoxin system Fst family toxin [Staphylococcus equorum]MDG0825888.1 type I toxin-antitoxin system Fst family toxin [Staphylococcus equorum]MDG0837164.1 type I toxin-antitoxin system Fst family toxin [Staphylococcus equorum]MDK9872586.1 type I toxin-antitoxin system Fst family toxin [Staphylococcus equorum]MDK9877392.1 type I toxin-antitoxin system Fst family toxin [Staphylococcus equorum]
MVAFFINVLATIISGCIIAMFTQWLRNRGEKQ